jgi:hypothetical protein
MKNTNKRYKMAILNGKEPILDLLEKVSNSMLPRKIALKNLGLNCQKYTD